MESSKHLWSSLAKTEKYIATTPIPTVIFFSLALSKYFPLPVDYDIYALDHRLALCEVVMHNTARPCLDIDVDVSNIVQDIEVAVTYYYKQTCGIDVKCRWKTAKDDVKTGWHLVVNGVYYYMSWMEECRKLATYIETLFSIQIDKGIYNRGKGLRLLGQCKKDGGRKLLKVGGYPNRDFLLYPAPSDVVLSYSSVQSSSSTPQHSPYSSGYSSPMTQHGTSRATKVVIDYRYMPVLDGMRLMGCNGGFYEYRRVRSSYCKICQRIHDTDNMYAYLIGTSKLRVKCWRAKEEGRNMHMEYDIPQEALVFNMMRKGCKWCDGM